MKTIKYCRLTMLTFLLGIACYAIAADEYPTGKDNTIGDYLVLSTDAYGFLPQSSGIEQTKRCAGASSTYTVDSIDGKNQTIRFHSVARPAGTDTCPLGAVLAQEATKYLMDEATSRTVRFKTTGIAFGALVVPFKFRMGGDRKITSSATIAPYLGFRSRRFQGFGVEIIPIVSAGLALVPVHDPIPNTTDTKAAFSTAFGLTLTSSKSADFSAGILFGKDFLSNTDKALDPSVNKMWFSLWVGVSK